MPSAPFSSASMKSPALPTLAYRGIFFPDFVTVSRVFIRISCSPYSCSDARSFRYFSMVSSSGLTRTVPPEPSTMHLFPEHPSGSSAWMTVGRCMAFARITAWEMTEPLRRTTASIFFRSKAATRLGVRSSATTTAFSGSVSFSSSCDRQTMRRSATSRTSAMRSRM